MSLCDSPIDLVVKMFDLFHIKLNYSTLMGLDNTSTKDLANFKV